MNKAYLNWSSGKDSALSLYYIKTQKEYKIEKLLTTINKEMDRVTMHGLRTELLLQQAEKLGLPIQISELNSEISMEMYNHKMKEATDGLISDGFTHSVFGDIFLEDLKQYREDQLKSSGLIPVFPLWNKNTKELISEFIDLGFKAVVVCTNSRFLNDSFCGRIIDQDFVKELPENVDPCGENGEFHTFVFDGPIFNSAVEFEIGEKVKKSYKPSGNDDDNCFSDDTESWDTEFCFCDLIP